MVLRGLKAISAQAAEGWLDEFISKAAIAISPVTSDQIAIARTAHQIFGKGLGHPEHLNFGDCFAYALAKSAGAPLLFKGDDFEWTDIEAALSV
jgi:ribonuclease VapC